MRCAYNSHGYTVGRRCTSRGCTHHARLRALREVGGVGTRVQPASNFARLPARCVRLALYGAAVTPAYAACFESRGRARACTSAGGISPVHPRAGDPRPHRSSFVPFLLHILSPPSPTSGDHPHRTSTQCSAIGAGAPDAPRAACDEGKARATSVAEPTRAPKTSTVFIASSGRVHRPAASAAVRAPSCAPTWRKRLVYVSTPVFAFVEGYPAAQVRKTQTAGKQRIWPETRGQGGLVESDAHIAATSAGGNVGVRGAQSTARTSRSGGHACSSSPHIRTDVRGGEDPSMQPSSTVRRGRQGCSRASSLDAPRGPTRTARGCLRVMEGTGVGLARSRRGRQATLVKRGILRAALRIRRLHRARLSAVMQDDVVVFAPRAVTPDQERSMGGARRGPGRIESSRRVSGCACAPAGVHLGRRSLGCTRPKTRDSFTLFLLHIVFRSLLNANTLPHIALHALESPGVTPILGERLTPSLPSDKLVMYRTSKGSEVEAELVVSRSSCPVYASFMRPVTRPPLVPPLPRPLAVSVPVPLYLHSPAFFLFHPSMRPSASFVLPTSACSSLGYTPSRPLYLGPSRRARMSEAGPGGCAFTIRLRLIFFPVALHCLLHLSCCSCARLRCLKQDNPEDTQTYRPSPHFLAIGDAAPAWLRGTMPIGRRASQGGMCCA
ncbi:hypothetical protein FB451DRAFT_1393899 [Mycena latifolia]|nr:hypothetical protein FB451DRAFT_1393899 [Mycena latifolia]